MVSVGLLGSCGKLNQSAKRHKMGLIDLCEMDIYIFKRLQGKIAIDIQENEDLFHI